MHLQTRAKREWHLKGSRIIETERQSCVPEDTQSVGHCDRAKTLVCWPDPRCLPPTPTATLGFAVICSVFVCKNRMADLNPDIGNMCSVVL